MSASVSPRALHNVVYSAYRNLSEPVILVIIGVIPVHLLACARQTVYHRKKDADIKVKWWMDQHFSDWQPSWDADSRGCESWKFISNVISFLIHLSKYSCGRWYAQRPNHFLDIGVFDSGNLAETMFVEGHTWNGVAHIIY